MEGREEHRRKGGRKGRRKGGKTGRREDQLLDF